MSDLVQYFPSNPDPALSACLNSGTVEDGVVFSGIEPLVGAYCYVGRTSIIEAAARLYDMSPVEVKAALGDGTAKAQKQIHQLQTDLTRVITEHTGLKEKLAELAGDDVR